jgi:hypothetical protein
MDENLPPDAVIATRRIGAVGFYADRTVFDYEFGLIHRSVARLIGEAKQVILSPHDERLASPWVRWSPDYFLEDLHIVDEVAQESGGTPEDFTIHGLHYRVWKTFPLGLEAQWALCERFYPQVEPISAPATS